MKNNKFYEQAALLLRIIPIVNRLEEFALKGGTAINFFIRDLPRLSVDIDLVYLPINNREESLKKISISLELIEKNILRLITGAKCFRKMIGNSLVGLIVNRDNAIVKVEVNTTIRGTVYQPVEYLLCKKAIELFEMSVVTKSLVLEELFAGKICAALDRQHPRDLYDIKLLFQQEGISEKTRKAFIVYLISHNRPIVELLNPNLSDIRSIYEQEFFGMTQEEVSLEDLLLVRETLITEIKKSLTEDEKKFLISFKSLQPEWSLLGLPGIDILPAVKWKLYIWVIWINKNI
ncbi:MAG: nucleotidyl transferase AbiEii/AbiGii toxin family protein [Melioribacteraceae bacterium]|nr:nucleotidyl transferase AbiEii/AbiGii toxin family protein [Melioribacteraceae bacterium]